MYESYSDFERPLRQFHSADEVLSQFERTYPNGKPWDTVYLQLYVLDAGPAFTPTRIELDPDRCGGATFRYSAAGWGLVQLHLNAPKAEYLGNSHTNHNSLKRAETWAPVVGLEAGPDAWDFERIIAFSSRLNRQIRKQSVGKLGSRPVLPGASQLWEQGVSLSPYTPGKDVLQIKK
ncbi:hypothetical protein [Achromobacter sp.]|uniref:hypothetical protein n=1 Tax=Achromobacter sp. TaxID=134375 RepID=UPI0028AE02A1|nr:hypothetical protein [Achromobacter sp.]